MRHCFSDLSYHAVKQPENQCLLPKRIDIYQSNNRHRVQTGFRMEFMIRVEAYVTLERAKATYYPLKSNPMLTISRKGGTAMQQLAP